MNPNYSDSSPAYNNWKSQYNTKTHTPLSAMQIQTNFFIDDQVYMKSQKKKKQVRVIKLQERVQSMERRLNNLNSFSPIANDADAYQIKARINSINHLDKDAIEFTSRQSPNHQDFLFCRDFNKNIQLKDPLELDKLNRYEDAKKESRILRQELDQLQEGYNKMTTQVKQTKGAKKESQKLRQELDALQIEYDRMSSRILEINKNFDQLVDNNKQLQLERDLLKRTLQVKQNERNLSSNLHEKDLEIIETTHQETIQEHIKIIDQKNKMINDLQNSHLQLNKECDRINDELQYQKANTLLTKASNDLHSHDEVKSNDQSKLIQLTIQEAFYLGQIAIYATDIILRHDSNELPTTLVMLQKDLASKKSMILNKMLVLKKIQDSQFNYEGNIYNEIDNQYDNYNMGSQDINLLDNIYSNRSQEDMSKKSSSQTNHFELVLRLQQENQNLQLKLSQNEQNSIFHNEDAISLLIIQCNTIERLIQG